MLPAGSSGTGLFLLFVAAGHCGWSGRAGVRVHEQRTASMDKSGSASKSETSDLQSALKANKQKY